jgi:ABC-type uncharacterized transport system substrate-binding protein
MLRRQISTDLTAKTLDPWLRLNIAIRILLETRWGDDWPKVKAGPLAAEVQQAWKVYRIGCLWAVPREAAIPYIKELDAGLNDLGHIEGVNVALEHRFADPPEDVPRFAEALVRSNVDALLATTNFVIAAAKRATTTIPIVMLYAADPVGAGLINSMAHPGGNVTGLSFDAAPEIYGKHVELLKSDRPR